MYDTYVGELGPRHAFEHSWRTYSIESARIESDRTAWKHNYNVYREYREKLDNLERYLAYYLHY